MGLARSRVVRLPTALTRKQLILITGLYRDTIGRLERRGEFPKRIVLCPDGKCAGSEGGSGLAPRAEGGEKPVDLLNSATGDILYQVPVNLTHSGDFQRHANRDSLMPLALGDAMAAAIVLRDDFTAQDLRRLARWTRDAGHARRLLALAEIYDGGARGDAARIGGVGLQTVRDWVLRFNAGGPEGLIDGKAPGQPSKLNDAQRQALAAIIESGPIPTVHGVVRWRLIDLAQWIWEEFCITIAKQTLSRELRTMGYRKLSARPRHHAQTERAIEDFKKAFPPVWKRLPRRRASILAR
jgi:transposase